MPTSDRASFRAPILLLALAASSSAQTGFGPSFDTVRPLAVTVREDGRRIAVGEVVVGVRSSADRGRVVAAMEAGGAKLLGQLPSVRAVWFQVPEGEEAAWIRAAAAIDGVTYAEPNLVGEGGGAAAPDDPNFPRQWHLHNTGGGGAKAGADIDALAAWGIQTGSPDVVIAVLDGGIDASHPEFAGRVLPGFDFVDESCTPTVDTKHGMLAAGLLAASGDNAFQISGVDRGGSILPIRVLRQTPGGGTFGSTTDVSQAIAYAVNRLESLSGHALHLPPCAAHPPADVLSMSLWNFGASQLMQDALGLAHDAGAVLVAAAGNGGVGSADQSYPGASPLTLSIGGTDANDQRAGWSGTGATLDFVAPGQSLLTIDPDPGSGSNDAKVFSMTSAATPVAAGIVALLLAQNPWLTPEQVHDLLVAGAEDEVGPPGQDPSGWDPFYGHGRLNAYESLRALCGCTEHEEFLSSPQTISVASGGAQLYRTDVGPGFAGAPYVVLGTTSGTSPGLVVDGLAVPLNFDAYTDYLLNFPNTAIVPSPSVLDAAGRAEALGDVPAGAYGALVGTTFHHAALVYDGQGTLQHVTNVAALTLVP